MNEVSETSKQAVIDAWTAAEKRIGKFVNLDAETLHALVTCPADMLAESVMSHMLAESVMSRLSAM